MALVSTAKNTMLDALTINAVSLHSAFPGLTGASEISGGAPAYARKAVTFGAASAALRTTTGSITFDVPASTVRWFGFWSGAAYMGYGPNGGTPKEFIASPATDTITCTSHGLTDTTKIVFYNGTLPSPLSEGTVYFVRDATTDTFKVAATSGGVAIDLTAAGSTDCVLSFIAEDVYGTQDTHTLTSATIGLPF